MLGPKKKLDELIYLIFNEFFVGLQTFPMEIVLLSKLNKFFFSFVFARASLTMNRHLTKIIKKLLSCGCLKKEEHCD
jgi:hypothetical protein